MDGDKKVCFDCGKLAKDEENYVEGRIIELDQETNLIVFKKTFTCPTCYKPPQYKLNHTACGFGPSGWVKNCDETKLNK